MAWIIGDIHGCIKTLKALLDKLPKDEQIIFVGDLIDRGTGSSEVIQLIREKNYDCVIGNHEKAMCDEILDLLEDNSLIQNSFWVKNCGGLETLKSYNSSTREQLISDVEWMKNLPYYLEYKNITNEFNRYLVVSHSSIGNYWQMKNCTKENLQYKDFTKKVIENRIQSPKDILEIFNIFGHTPRKMPLVEEHFANIDTGAYYMSDDGYGYLTALEYPSLNIKTQKNID